jgi:hypothetical protein
VASAARDCEKGLDVAELLVDDQSRMRRTFGPDPVVRMVPPQVADGDVGQVGSQGHS